MQMFINVIRHLERIKFTDVRDRGLSPARHAYKAFLTVKGIKKKHRFTKSSILRLHVHKRYFPYI